MDAIEMVPAVWSNIRYVDSGFGTRPIVLLHGLGNSLDFWSGVAPPLSKSRRVVALDIPGFGLSAPPPDGVTLQSLSALIGDLLDHIGLSELVAVGHSMGGTVALELGRQRPDLMTKVVLVDGTLLAASRILRHPLAAFRDAQIAANLLLQFVGGLIPFNRRTAQWIARSKVARRLLLWPFVFDPVALNQDLLARALRHNGGLGALRALIVGHQTCLPALMRSVDQPVELIWGSNDRLLEAQDMVTTRTLVKVIRTTVLPECGHWPLIEYPSNLARLLADV